MGMADEYGERIQRAVRAQIRAEIAVRGLKQNEVARKAGMHTSTLSRYLSDDEDRGLPFWALGAVAKALGMTTHEIAARAEDLLARGEVPAAGGDPEEDDPPEQFGLAAAL